MEQPDQSPDTRKPEQPKIDWFILIAGTAILLALVLPAAFAPAWTSHKIDLAYEFITKKFGIYYIIAAITITVFLLAIAFSRHGGRKLGPAGVRPVYSSFAWGSMLFCTGIGASLIYWGAAEWAMYYDSPPFGVAARSDQAIIWGATYGMFHWGPLAWALYCLPTIAFCCSYHIREMPILRLSAACSGVLGKYTGRWPGRIIDLLFIVGLLGTAATGLAFGTELVSSTFTRFSRSTLLPDLDDGFGMQLSIMILATLLIAYSVYRGLDKGIKILSVINATLVLVLIGFVLIVGPTKFILEMGVLSLGHLAQNFIRMMTWTDPLARAEFVESWTIFYWAWWLALGPFVGMFVAKISRGRTLREVIFGMMAWGSLGCALFFIVLGNYALDLELSSAYPVVEKIFAESPSWTIAAILEMLPMGKFWLLFVAVVALIFTATTYDSATYTLAAGATKSLRTDQHPIRMHRVYWAITLGLLPSALLFLGGLDPLRTASVLASFPLLFVYVILIFSIIAMLREPEADASP
ncbi:MAG: BCCT family transporter [Gammaproteobacteria bacterium]|nr:BCCT family transporter [Gammaproteobacteria bacterium]